MPTKEEVETQRLKALFEKQKKDAQALEAIALAKQAEAAAAAEASSKAEHYRDLENKAQPKWEEVSKMAKEFYHNRQMGYDSLQSAMSAQFAFCLVTAEALQAQAPIFIGGIVDFIGGIVDVVIPKSAPQELELRYNLDFNFDKGVSFKLERSDGKQVTQELADTFSALVVDSFRDQGYIPTNDNGDLSQFHHVDARALDATAFPGIKRGFETYLQNIASPNPSPTPRM